MTAPKPRLSREKKPPPVKPSLTDDVRVTSLCFGSADVRTQNCLRNAGILTVGQLAQWTDAELLALDNFGRKSLNAVRDIIPVEGDGVKPKPTCATCFHYEPENEQGGACMGVAPKAFMKANEQVVGAFPPVKATSRCPNWKQG